MVGQPRSSMNDDEMRAWIKIRIKLNRCNGTPEELLSILSLLLGHNYSLTLMEYPPRDVVFMFFGPLTMPPEAVFSLIKRASPPGFKRHFINAAFKMPFQLDTSAFLPSQFADFF
jgi:hypothetical protein